MLLKTLLPSLILALSFNGANAAETADLKTETTTLPKVEAKTVIYTCPNLGDIKQATDHAVVDKSDNLWRIEIPPVNTLQKPLADYQLNAIQLVQPSTDNSAQTQINCYYRFNGDPKQTLVLIDVANYPFEKVKINNSRARLIDKGTPNQEWFVTKTIQDDLSTTTVEFNIQ